MAKRKLQSSHSDPIYYTTLKTKTPLGLIGIAGSEKGLSRIIPKISSESQFKNYLKKSFSSDCLNNPPFFDDAVKQLNLYFSGKLKKFTCKLDLSQGTPFQQKVWRKIDHHSLRQNSKLSNPGGSHRSSAGLSGRRQRQWEKSVASHHPLPSRDPGKRRSRRIQLRVAYQAFPLGPGKPLKCHYTEPRESYYAVSTFLRQINW